MRFIYNILYAVFFLLSAPYYFLKMWRRGNWREGFGQRFGRYDPALVEALAKKPVLWLHAVSVGEVGVCLQLIKALEPRVPDVQIIVSTTTSTGMGELKARLPTHIHKIYYPVDFCFVVRRAMNAIRPRAIILVEAEFWPNLLWQAQDRNIPIFLVNARISERSFRGYSRFSFIFRPFFAQFKAAGCQNAADAQRLISLGFPETAVQVTGNLKFDAAKPDARPGLDVPALLRQINVPENARLLVAGSTHAGEAAILGEMLLRLRQKFPDLFLILVPRHFEKAADAGQELTSKGVKFVLRTALAPGDYQCLLVNSTGELKYFYQHATLVFVGKSLTVEGGQNPIEPAALGKPTLFGPNMQNFTSIVRSLRENYAAIQVPDAAELERACAELLTNETRRRELGENARRFVEANAGATEKTVNLILEQIPKL